VTPNKGSGSQYWDIVYVSEVNKAKVKSDGQVGPSYEQEFKPMQNFFLSGGWGTVPRTLFFQSSLIVRNQSS